MFQKILFTIGFIFCAWVGISYIDILANNLHSGTLAFWNLFGLTILQARPGDALSQNKALKDCSQKKTQENFLKSIDFSIK